MNKKLFTSLRWVMIPMFIIGFLTMFFPAKEWMNNIPNPFSFGCGVGSLFILFMHTVLYYTYKYILKSEEAITLYSSFRYVLIPMSVIGLLGAFLCTAKKFIMDMTNPFMVGWTLSAFLILFGHSIFCHLGSKNNE